MTHLFTVLLALVMTLLLWIFPRPWLVFLFFALVFGPGVFCNAVFHAAATSLSRAYCPGVITGLGVYIPLSLLLAQQALSDGLLSSSSLAAACAIAPVFHAVEVGHNVFKRW